MKKAILILLVGLFWCSVGFALPKCEGEDNSKWTMCEGTKTYDDGGKYVGEFKNSKRHGQGTITYANGDKYVGEWKNDKVHGQGTSTNSDGVRYVGEFKDGAQHGQATVTYADGGKYVGEIKNGNMHGQGTLTYADGTVIVAIFKKGKFVKKLSTDTSAKEKMKLASMVDEAKDTCKELGFTEGTEKFSDCSLKLYSQSVELAAKNNQQVVGTSSGGSVTIYDPVRDSRALMRQGQRMLSGACTFGIDC